MVNNHLSIINNHFALSPSTFVESPLQIHLFMQNEPNFRNAKNERKLICHKGLWEYNHLRTPPKQPQNKPNLSLPKGDQTLFQIDDFLGIFHLATAVFYLKF